VEARSFDQFSNGTAVFSQEVLNAFPAGVMVCNSKGVIEQSNDELCRMFGYEQGQLDGALIASLIPDDKNNNHQVLLSGFFNFPEKRIMGRGRELYAKRKDGSQMMVEIGLNPVSTPHGLRVVATVVDVASRYDMEKNFRQVVDAAPVGMLIIDMNGTITHANQQLERIFGYTLADMQGNPVEMLLPHRYRGSHVALRQGFVGQPAVRAMGGERDLTGLHKNGEEIPVEIGLNPIKFGSQMSVIATITDITQRKRAELKLQQANADLDEFTYVASHDLKSPLRGIGSLIEWIEEDLGENISADVKNNIERIHLRIHRTEKLIEDLLSYAKSGKKQGEAKKFNIGESLDSVLSVLDIPPTFKIEKQGYMGDMHSYDVPLETVLRNLISNSIKHNDKGAGNIRIVVDEDGSVCKFEVSDDGPGIPSNAHERVFKLFQTLSANDKTRSGVGLAVCKRLVEAHGGSIRVASNDGSRGTSFYFTWPRYARSDIND